MSTPPIVTEYAGPTPYKLTNVVTGTDIFSSNFYPNQISDLAVWLDGKDILGNGTNPNFGTNIPVWVNKASNSITVTQTNEEYKPSCAANNEGVFFNNNNIGVGENVKGFNTNYGTINNNETIFILLSNTTNSVNRYNLLYPSIGNGGRQLYLLSNSPSISQLTTGIRTEEETTNILVAGDVVEGEPTLVTSLNNSSDVKHYINGGIIGSAEATSYTGNSATLIGTDNYEGNQGFNGTISEIIIYSNAISDSDREKVESYLRWKWNSFTLDPSNPYATQAYSNVPPYPKINPNLIPPVPRNLYSGLPTLDSNNYPLIKNFIQLPNRLRNVMF
jgi:hypothetical protein